MRLSNLVPSIPVDVVNCLETLGIRTDVDLLFSTTTLDLFKHLPAGTATLEELTNYKAFAAEMGSASSMSGFELLQNEIREQDKDIQFHTGSGELDGFLRGLDGRWIIELSGNKGSGKSTLALNLVLHQLASYHDSTAIWIDTAGDFSPERAAQVLYSKQISSSALERLQVSLAYDIEAMQELLDALIQADVSQPRPRLLVIDTITPLLGPLLSAVTAEGHAIMTDFMRQLQNYARLGTTVIVINNTSRKGLDTLEKKPALGPSFVLMTDTTLWLRMEADNDMEDSVLHSIQILKSRSVVALALSAFGTTSYVRHECLSRWYFLKSQSFAPTTVTLSIAPSTTYLATVHVKPTQRCEFRHSQGWMTECGSIEATYHQEKDYIIAR